MTSIVLITLKLTPELSLQLSSASQMPAVSLPNFDSLRKAGRPICCGHRSLESSLHSCREVALHTLCVRVCARETVGVVLPSECMSVSLGPCVSGFACMRAKVGERACVQACARGHVRLGKEVVHVNVRALALVPACGQAGGVWVGNGACCVRVCTGTPWCCQTHGSESHRLIVAK